LKQHHAHLQASVKKGRFFAQLSSKESCKKRFPAHHFEASRNESPANEINKPNGWMGCGVATHCRPIFSGRLIEFTSPTRGRGREGFVLFFSDPIPVPILRDGFPFCRETPRPKISTLGMKGFNSAGARHTGVCRITWRTGRADASTRLWDTALVLIKLAKRTFLLSSISRNIID